MLNEQQYPAVPAEDGIDEMLPAPKLVAFGLQHLFAMFGGMVSVPLIVGAGIGLGADDIAELVTVALFLAGVGTLVQSLGAGPFGGIRFPLVMGASFLTIAVTIEVGSRFGMATLSGSLIVASVIALAIVPLISRVRRFLPDVVLGTTILLVGLTLIPSATGLIVGSDPTAHDYAAGWKLAMSAGTMLLIVACYRFLPRVFMQASVLIALVVGSIVGVATGVTSFDNVTAGGVVGVPQPFHFGAPKVDIVAVISLLVILVVLMVESIGTAVAIGGAAGRDVGPRGISRLLRADMVLAGLAGVFPAVPTTTYGLNVGVVTLTGVRSRFVTAACAVPLLVLAFFPPVARGIASTIPQPVLGGASLIIFGTIAVVGMQTLLRVDLRDTRNLIILSTSLAVGLIPSMSKGFYQALPERLQFFLNSGVAAGTVTAVLLSAAFGLTRRVRTDEREEARAEPLAFASSSPQPQTP